MEYLWVLGLMSACSLVAAAGSVALAWRSVPNRIVTNVEGLHSRVRDAEAKVDDLASSWTRARKSLEDLSDTILEDVERAETKRKRAAASRSKVEAAQNVPGQELGAIADPSQRRAEAVKRARSMGLHA